MPFEALDFYRIDDELSEDERLAHGREMGGHHDLVGQLGNITGAHIPGQHNIAAHGVQKILALVEYLLFSADHDGQRGVDGSRLAAAHRRIQKFNGFLGALPGDFL